MESLCVSYNRRLFSEQSESPPYLAEENPQQQLRNQLRATIDLFHKDCYDVRLGAIGIKKHHSFNNEMQRREHFGAMLDALETTVGMSRDVARQELLSLVSGSESTVLNQYLK